MSSRENESPTSDEAGSPPGTSDESDIFDPFLAAESAADDDSGEDAPSEAEAEGAEDPQEDPAPDSEDGSDEDPQERFSSEAEEPREELEEDQAALGEDEGLVGTAEGVAPPEPLTEKPKVVLMTEGTVEPVLRDPVRTGSTILAVIGGALCIAWLTRMLLLWFPLNLMNAAWTFGTVVETVDSLPSAAVGGALLTYALIRHPRAPTRIVRRLSTVFAALAALFLLIGFFYLASVPASFAQAPDVSVQPLRRTVVQTIIELLVAAGACSAVAALLWRGVRKSKRHTGS